MNFFFKPKEQSETRFGFALARKSLLKTNFSINQALSGVKARNRRHYPFLHASELQPSVKQKGHVRWCVGSPTASPTFFGLLLSETL